MKHLHSCTALTPNTLFADSQETGLEYVLRLDADRLLAPCYVALGHEPRAANYGGWESRQIAGHSLGHYLSALAGFVGDTGKTGDARAKEKLDYTVARIGEIQRADGYFGGVPSTPFDAVATNGEFTVERFELAGFWVPWYSVHKIYCGLVDAYLRGGNEDALDIVRRMADWVIARFADVGEAAFQRMLGCEHGGMCAVFADLFGITGEDRYRTMAERFIHREIVDPAMRREDTLSGYHANTQIPKFIGLARLYELTGKAEYRTAVEFFFATVLETQTYAIGGNSIGEHFQGHHKEALGFDTCETCNTYNMLELTEHIFSWNRTAGAADYYERALYNHILASQDPASGAKTYFMSTKSGTCHVYCSEENAFWCCTGTGMENPERYNRFICKDYDGVLYLNLFVASTVTTSDGWTIRIDTAFPYSEKVEVTVLAAGTKPRALKIRRPSWIDASRCDDSCIGEVDKEGWWIASASLDIGQNIDFNLPMNLHARRTRNGSGNFNILYGPIVLAADLGKEGMPPSDILDDQSALRDWPAVSFPDFTGDVEKPDSWITPVDGATLSFRTVSEAATNGASYELKPFYAIHHANYALYFMGAGVANGASGSGCVGDECCTSGAQGDAGHARERALASVTVDTVECGRQQSEIDHGVTERGTSISYIASIDRNCRVVSGNGNYIAYEMKFSLTETNRVLVSVYGKDAGVFSVAVDGTPVASASLDGTGDDEAIDREFTVNEAITGAQSGQVALSAQDAPGAQAEGKRVVSIMSEGEEKVRVFEVRVLRG
jgi:DUF1680 family protein